MSKLKLFKVEYVSQQNGQLVDGYFMCNSLAELEQEIADITEIYPLSYEVLGDD